MSTCRIGGEVSCIRRQVAVLGEADAEAVRYGEDVMIVGSCNHREVKNGFKMTTLPSLSIFAADTSF